MSFPEIGLTHYSNIEISKKLEEFSRNRSGSRPEKTEILKKEWISFPGFANRG